ncbi:hypothetical protein OSSY52_11780 [Tepiditoga spiralis]|uniref:GmrSD restriction endonucleases N-terminal domain-containing protein n=1 Tax=Tepiditoga spiralis TaxID=2108365 RepID=A0A7G1G7X0_9BACT|nr:DUF262 domain-containing protein [Tepiditoga spiralis]BBE31037.1 hypothetical protein OSSY52_11780 [Tepiditoga spiralis]
MNSQKYAVNQPLIETLINWVKSGEIAIPEIQRPFVWSSKKVRDLMDSLYQGYPIGYIIAWKNPNVKLKDGSLSEGKKILIDGQQRVTSLTAAIIGQKVVNKDYKKIKIQIAFNPLEEKFETLTPAIAKDKKWIDDVSTVFNGNLFDIVGDYLENNPDADKLKIQTVFQDLINIPKKQIGLIELSGDLDIEKVTEIFIRINSQGVELSQADFVMSKISSNETYGGNLLRKAIDYFSHLSKAPEYYSHIAENDTEFSKTDYFQKISWLKNENGDLYNPTYKDILRVAFTFKFNRGKLSDLVSLLSGRNFETREFEEEITKQSYDSLISGVKEFINETNFKRFLMIIKSAGFVDNRLIRSVNALNFAYILYLKLKEQKYNSALIEKYVKKWFVLTILTRRYSGSPESEFDFDIKNISQKDFGEYLKEIEDAQLSDAFWNAELIQRLNTSISTSPVFNVFLASQCYFNDKGFLSKDITVKNLIEQRGDVHHIFPRDLLKKKDLTRGQYNQIANYVYTQSEINIKIGNKPIEKYLQEVKEQCNGGELKYGGITEFSLLEDNFKQNAVPISIFEITMDDYQEFLIERRKLMAEKMRKYYEKI